MTEQQAQRGPDDQGAIKDHPPQSMGVAETNLGTILLIPKTRRTGSSVHLQDNESGIVDERINPIASTQSQRLANPSSRHRNRWFSSSTRFSSASLLRINSRLIRRLIGWRRTLCRLLNHRSIAIDVDMAQRLLAVGAAHQAPAGLEVEF